MIIHSFSFSLRLSKSQLFSYVTKFFYNIPTDTLQHIRFVMFLGSSNCPHFLKAYLQMRPDCFTFNKSF